MIVDTSAFVALLKNEPERQARLEALYASPVRLMSVVSFLETAIVVDGLRDPAKSRRLDEIVSTLDVDIVDVTPSQVRVARQAYRDYGKGSGHPAGLNFGDVFAYALATTTGQPLLFKGRDFSETDVESAL